MGQLRWPTYPRLRVLSLSLIDTPIFATRRGRSNEGCRSDPSQFLQSHTRMPDLRHVADLVASELHYVDIVRRRLLAGRLTRTTGTGVSTRKDSIGNDIVSLGVGGEGFHLVATVRHNRH